MLAEQRNSGAAEQTSSRGGTLVHAGSAAVLRTGIAVAEAAKSGEEDGATVQLTFAAMTEEQKTQTQMLSAEARRTERKKAKGEDISRPDCLKQRL